MKPIASNLAVSCAVCGADCEPEASFCPHCGSPLERTVSGADPLLEQLLEGRYRLTERLGVEVLGFVYRGQNLSTGAVVTVRVIHDHLARHRNFARRFAEQARASYRLVHPGILRTLDSGRIELAGRPVLFVVSEPFEGRNLSAIVQDRGLLPVPQVLSLGLQVLDALAEAHRLGFIHLDLKPENILLGVSAEGELRTKLTNFGLASLAAESMPRLGGIGATLGMALYAAPELLRAESPSSGSDLYSLAVILYELLAGARPFDSSSSLALEWMHQQDEPVPLRQRAPSRGIGPAVEAVLDQALAKDPAQRFRSAAQMSEALLLARREDAKELGGEPSQRGALASGQRKLRTVVRSDLLETMLASAFAPLEPTLRGGAVSILLGGAGLGKTALVQELIDRLSGGPIAVLRLEGRRALCRPLEPFAELARDLVGVSRGADPDLVERLSQTLCWRFGFEQEDVLRLMDRLTARPSSLGVTDEVAEREEERTLRAFLGRVLASCPSLLVIEDADALDAASLGLVLDLMEAAATLPLSVLVTARAEPWPEWRAAHVRRLTLNALDREPAYALLRGKLGTLSVPVETLEAIVQWAKGSPLLLELCAQAMVRRDQTGLRDGKWNPSALGPDLFAGMRELVAMVLRSVEPPARRWLSFGALAGPRTPIELLQAWEPASQSVEQVLGACLETGFVHLADGSMVYENEGVRDVVRALVPEDEQTQICRLIADWLGQGEPMRASAELVAGYAEAAGEWEHAAVLLQQEAEQLRVRGESRAAATLLGRAWQAWQHVGQSDSMVHVGLEQASALLDAGDGKAASDVLHRLERFGNVEAEGLRARIMATMALGQGDMDVALKALTRASDVASEWLDQLAWFQVENQLAELLFDLGRLEQAEQHAALAHELARSIADSQGQNLSMLDSARVSRAASFLAKLHLSLERPVDAQAVLQRALEYAAQLGDEASASRLLANLAHVASHGGNLQEALVLGQRALEYARKVGDRMAAARIAINVGTYQAKLGMAEESRHSFLLAKDLSRSIGWSKGLRLAREASLSLGRAG